MGILGKEILKKVKNVVTHLSELEDDFFDVPDFLLMEVMSKRSEKRKRHRSFLIPRPPGMETKSYLMKDRSGDPIVKSGAPSIRFSISLILAACCSKKKDSFSIRLILSANSWTKDWLEINSSWSGWSLGVCLISSFNNNSYLGILWTGMISRASNVSFPRCSLVAVSRNLTKDDDLGDEYDLISSFAFFQLLMNRVYISDIGSFVNCLGDCIKMSERKK